MEDKNSWESLTRRMLEGSTRALARMISKVENREPGWMEAMKKVYPHTGRARVVGITGPPGAGKSTLTNAISKALIARGHKVGVVAVDPSSPFSGGSLLGDRVRMKDLWSNDNVFIRSMATRGALGGLNRSARDVVKLLDAFGKDFIIIETVGVGQDEIEVVNTADLVLLVLVPGQGDGIQALKAGVMEIAEIYVINKADHQGVDELEADIENMLTISGKADERRAPLFKTVASSFQGVEELVRRALEMLEDKDRRLEWQKTRLENELVGLMEGRLQEAAREFLDRDKERILREVALGEKDPYSAADEALAPLWAAQPNPPAAKAANIPEGACGGAENPEGSGPLSGLTVIDLSRILAGPYCTMLLADLGARVIKVEEPGNGDNARLVGPFLGEESGYFHTFNRNKESIALDLKAPADRLIFEALLMKADVLVENYRPGVLRKLGYGWEVLKERFPRLILASASGFGQTGPYRNLPAYDMVVQAMGGMMSVTGQPGAPPTRVGVSIGDMAAGMFLSIAVQAALIERTRTGKGKHCDISMLDCQVALLENAFARYQITGEIPGPIGARHPSAAPFGVFAAADGWLVISAASDKFFAMLCKLIGAPELVADERFVTRQQRIGNVERLTEELESRLKAQTADHWLKVLTENGIPCGPLNDLAKLIEDPQLRHREMIREQPAGSGKTLLVPGSPLKFAGEPVVQARPAPRLDQHREQILAELGM